MARRERRCAGRHQQRCQHDSTQNGCTDDGQVTAGDRERCALVGAVSRGWKRHNRARLPYRLMRLLDFLSLDVGADGGSAARVGEEWRPAVDTGSGKVGETGAWTGRLGGVSRGPRWGCSGADLRGKGV